MVNRTGANTRTDEAGRETSRRGCGRGTANRSDLLGGARECPCRGGITRLESTGCLKSGETQPARGTVCNVARLAEPTTHVVCEAEVPVHSRAAGACQEHRAAELVQIAMEPVRKLLQEPQ